MKSIVIGCYVQVALSFICGSEKGEWWISAFKKGLMNAVSVFECSW